MEQDYFFLVLENDARGRQLRTKWTIRRNICNPQIKIYIFKLSKSISSIYYFFLSIKSSKWRMRKRISKRNMASIGWRLSKHQETRRRRKERQSVQTRRKYSSRCAIKLALFTSVTLVWNGCSRRNRSQGRGAPPPPRKNEINATLWHRTKGKGLPVNLTTLRFRLRNSFRRMETIQRGASNCSPGSRDEIDRCLLTCPGSNCFFGDRRPLDRDGSVGLATRGRNRLQDFAYNDLFVRKREREMVDYLCRL